MFSTLIVIFGALTVCNAASPLLPPIFGGEYSSILAYPYHVAVESEEGLCGGTIIDESWVLTAAHCIPAINTTTLVVRSGTSYKMQGGIVHPISNIYVHCDYHWVDGVPQFDIALLKLVDPIKFDKIRQPAIMVGVDYEVRPGTWGVICGWGRSDKYPETGQLQSVAVPLMGWKACQRYYDAVNWSVPKDNFCGGYMDEGGRDSCQGDSGGPLMINGRLAGIVSWGKGCADKRFPGAYASVGIHRRWIYKISGV